MLGACTGVGVKEQLLCPFDAGPVWGGLGLGEQDLLHWFVEAWDVGDEPVADCWELEVGDECVAVVVGRESCGVEHGGPEFPAFLKSGVSGLGSDRFHVVFDGSCFGCFLARGWDGDPVRGFDEAAAIDEFGVDRTGLGRADGQGEAGAWFVVVRGEGFASDEESVADGDAVFGEDAGERGDGGCMRFGLPGLAGFAGVDGEENGRGSGVAGEVVGDRACVGELLAGLTGEVDAQGRSDAVVVHGDADQALLGPEAQGVPDEAEDI